MKVAEEEMIYRSIEETQRELSNLYHLLTNLEHDELDEITDEITKLQDNLGAVDWKFPDVEDE